MLKQVSHRLDAVMKKVNVVVGVICVVILASIFTMMTLEVLSRSMFQVSFTWIMELSRFGLVVIIFLGGSIVFHLEEHISVTIFHKLFSPKQVLILKSLFDLLMLCFLATYWWYSIDYTLAGIQTPSVSRMMYMVYPRSAIPIGFLLMWLQVFNNLLKRMVKFQE